MFTEKDVDFIVVAAHLYYKEDGRKIRARQIGHLTHVLHHMQQSLTDPDIKLRVQNALVYRNIILSGDLNMHFPGENKVLEEHGYYDLWLERYSHFDGYTWDPDYNSMLMMKEPFDNRKMRLDRIAIKRSTQLDLEEIEKVAVDPLDRVFLYPSDHFGILATFKKSPTGFVPQDNEYKREYIDIPQDVTGYRTEFEIRLYQYSVSFAMLIFILYSIRRL